MEIKTNCGYGDMWRGNMSTEFDFDSLDGEMTPESAARLISGELEGDTPKGEMASKPELAPEPKVEQVPLANDDELNSSNAVLLAKDGKHTIKFEKLESARSEAKSYKAQLDEANQQLEQLKAELKARSDNGHSTTSADANVAAVQAAIDSGADISLFGDFSEEAMASGITKLVEKQVQAKVDAIVSQRLAPIEQERAVSAAESHYGAIYQAHPDADSIVESQELADWLESKPSFVKTAYMGVLTNGSASDVIDLFSDFKAATGTQKSTDVKADPKLIAKQVVANAKSPVPSSLSDIPGGAGVKVSGDEALAQATDGRDMLERMQGMSSKQIEDFLNKQL